jgi:DNA-binding SARP family transcriptional activator
MISMTLPQASRRECLIDGRIIKLKPQQHQFLVLLLMRHPEHWVSYTDIIEYLWPDPDDQPLSARWALQKYASEFRHKYGIAVDMRRSDGYRIPAHTRRTLGPLDQVG